MSTTAPSSTPSATRCDRRRPTGRTRTPAGTPPDPEPPADRSSADPVTPVIPPTPVADRRSADRPGHHRTGPAPGADSTGPDRNRRPMSRTRPATRTAADPERRRVAGPPLAVVDSSPAGERLAFGFNLAKITGQGEDADPILHEARDLGLVAVFDGMGGAGGTAYQPPRRPPHRRVPRIPGRPGRRRTADARPAASRERATGRPIAAELHDSIEHALRSAVGRTAGAPQHAAVKTVAGVADHHGNGRGAPPRTRHQTAGNVTCCGRVIPGFTCCDPHPGQRN